MLAVNALPVFADIDPATSCVDPKAVEAAISPRTAAVIAVHLTGHPADMDALATIAERRGLALIEDVAQAHGAVWSGRPVGGIGNVGSWSFQSSKNLTSGEGGAVTTNDHELAEIVASLCNCGRIAGRRGTSTTASVATFASPSGRRPFCSQACPGYRSRSNGARHRRRGWMTTPRCRRHPSPLEGPACDGSCTSSLRLPLRTGCFWWASQERFRRQAKPGRYPGLGRVQRPPLPPASFHEQSFRREGDRLGSGVRAHSL